MPDKRAYEEPEGSSPPSLLAHGAAELPQLTIDAYNTDSPTSEGSVGDRISKGAFQDILTQWRARLATIDTDPLGEAAGEEIGKKELDKTLASGDPEAAGLILSAIDEFALDFADVIARFLRMKQWKETQCIVVGGGLRQSRIGELSIGRAAVALKAAGMNVDLRPIRYSSDHAGLVGSVHLVPSWIFAGHDSILAVDIGGTNIRAGIVELKLSKADDLSAATVRKLQLWRHRDDAPKRDDAVEQLIGFLNDLIKQAKKDALGLAPFIGIGCPGVIRADGTIETGSQNLPGNWEAKNFNLVERIRDAIPKIGGHDTVVALHNDAVVQGLSEVPWMQDIKHWGVMTIGTGLGNAHFTMREQEKKHSKK